MRSWRILHSQLPKDGYLDDAFALEFVPDLEYATAVIETKRIRDNLSTAWSSRKVAQTSQPIKNAQKPTSKRPPTCDCPSATHPQTRPKSKTPTMKSRFQVRLPEVAANETGEISDSDEDAASKDAATMLEGESSDRLAESSARTCTKCEKLKRAPRGKKIAWRGRANKWMYVHKDAPDEEGPAEEQDDDEPLPGGESERKAVVATTVEAPGFTVTNGRYQQSDNAYRTQIAKDGVVTVPAGTNQPEANPSTVVASSAEATSDTQETPDQQEVSSAAHQNAAATESMPLAGETETTTTPARGQLTQAGSKVGAQELSLKAGTLPTHESPVPSGADVESKKRQNETEIETPAPKKARVDIDLTMDDDDDLVVIKTERIDASESLTSTQEDADDMEHELEQLEIEERILEVKKRMADIKRKLAKSRAHGRSKRSNSDGTVIKIED